MKQQTARQAAAASFHRTAALETGIVGCDGFCIAHVLIVQQAAHAPWGHLRKDCAITSPVPAVDDREQGSAFMPKFDAAGLLCAIAQDAASGAVLMVAFMDAEALAATRATGKAHFHSRSRGRLWMKGESSGHVLLVDQILVDCDQDALLLKVRPAGPACHTGAPSCFYRELDGEGLARTGASI